MIHKFYDSTETAGSTASKFGVSKGGPSRLQGHCPRVGVFANNVLGKGGLLLFCRLGELAALKANPFTFVPSREDC